MSTEKGKHYKGVAITHDMVGQPLDPAFIEKHYTMDAMQFQAFKKVMFAGKRGKKDRIQDFKDAIGAIERQIELDGDTPELMDEEVINSKAKPTHELITEWDVNTDCNGCIFKEKDNLLRLSRKTCDKDWQNSMGFDCSGNNYIFKLKEIKR